ncbi:YqcC family protein [Pseudomonas typographi]|uniref:YqcC family protein n=1 Tax=Pseudomonas typographi TaxID=2715964 RepID=UPI001689FC8A|nr:YqcC family protein [Pseudomonas typographi]MBD1553732.1 YqcC family protein [Pseudomonas typographi]
MDPRVPRLAEQLLLIERELRLQGWWGAERPAEQLLASVEPFCVDTLAFEQWLQWVFLPRMKTILEQDLALPNASGILAMAEVVYAARPHASQGLRDALKQFDGLISRG